MKKDTSWNTVAEWYDTMLEDRPGTYQKDVILPNLERLLKIKPGERVLDVGCGTGFFARAFATAKAEVVGVDNGAELIKLAKKHSSKGIEYHVASADDMAVIPNQSIDTITIILALQNIEKVSHTIAECARVLKQHGRLVLVLNHPAFRIPKASSWEWNADKNVQFRRIDRYLSETKIPIAMHPGEDPSNKTVSFHRPLQVYFKALTKHHLAVSRLEEWISHRQGPAGKTFAALERSRKEIPIFLFLEAKLLS